MDELVHEVTSRSFAKEVVEASHARPVIVDFWATWCGPCRMLAPVLERVVNSLQGKVALAKVNVDENRDLAGAWQIRSIPAVKIFRHGKVVGEFVGALPEAEIRKRLADLLPSRADELAEEGDELLTQGKPLEAQSKYREALAEDPRHVQASLRLAAAALDLNEVDEAERLLAATSPGPAEMAQVDAVRARIWFARQCGDGKARDEEAPELAQEFEQACRLAAHAKYQQALEALLKIIRTDRQYGKGEPKEAMVRIFAILGPEDALVRDYRRQMNSALYV